MDSAFETAAGLSVLVIDDDPKIREYVGDFLTARGHRAHLAGDGREGLAHLSREAVDIVITDVRMPGMDGFEVLREVQRLSPDTDVIIITGYREIEQAFRAIREGAFDFFTKPLKVEELKASLQRTARFQALRRENARSRSRQNLYQAEAQQRYGLNAIVGDSPAIREMKAQIGHLCEMTNHTTVLVCGETGTGKDLVARAIHHNGVRRDGPFVTLNCAALPEGLAESELFGHEKGAFTGAMEKTLGRFERADGGTLLLDEIAEIAPPLQAKLLRAIEDGTFERVGGETPIEVDVRIVATTNRNLEEEVQAGRFREDLFFRLNVVAIETPPLRERLADVLPLATYFLDRYTHEMRKRIDGFTPEAEAALCAHPFPGNVRELKNRVEHAVIFCGSDRIGASDLNLESNGRANGLDLSDTGAGDLTLAAVEKAAIGEALRRCDNNRTRAADLLGIDRYRLRRLMKEYGILSSER